MKLFCANSENKLLHYKFNEEISVVAVWRDEKITANYLRSKGLASEFEVDEFTFEDFDSAKEWHEKSNPNLFIHLID